MDQVGRWARRLLGSGSGGAYEGLRRQILDASPARLGIAPSGDLPRVWGLVMDMGYPNGTATLVAVADGSTSLYYSTGGGIIGGGFHPQVAEATQRLLMAVEASLDTFARDIDPPLPVAGGTVFRVLLFNERPRGAAGDADRLGSGTHDLSSVFFAAHDVIGELRMISEAGP